jgi:predicted nucleotidyltransferase
MVSLGVQHPFLISLIMAHSLSFLCNGHVFAMLTHDLFWYSPYKDKNKFLRYLDSMYERMNTLQPAYIEGVVFFGSLARGVFRETSDLDVRFIAKPGFWNGIKSSHLVFHERFRALLAGFPIDTYMFASEKEVRSKMDVQNEHPVSLYNSDDNLKRILPETQPYARFKGTIFHNEKKNIL